MDNVLNYYLIIYKSMQNVELHLKITRCNTSRNADYLKVKQLSLLHVILDIMQFLSETFSHISEYLQKYVIAHVGI